MAIDNLSSIKPNHYPWQAQTWSRVNAALTRLPHGLLLHGVPGTGKVAFAKHLAYQLLCQAPTDAGACGSCKSCLLLAAGNHPDLVLVEPESAGKAIVVDQIRALTEFLYYRPHIAQRKVTVIAPAEAMNMNAGNSLLKILEEPPLGSLILLVSHNPSMLSATVRSRCTRISFNLPAPAQALAWLTQQTVTSEPDTLLKLAAGAPLNALLLDQDGFLQQREQLLLDMEQLAQRSVGVSSCAERWKKTGTLTCLEWLQSMVGDLIKHLMGSPIGNLRNADKIERLQALVKQLNLKKLYGFLDTINEARRALSGPIDEQLLLEDLLIRWHRLAVLRQS
ncbi:MAG: DNA polymerase III subunit delta' [Gammaproteobacteria bacterium]|nr:DNA polymerase III subunit delta' [Gammaproteobacteria bacterium]